MIEYTKNEIIKACKQAMSRSDVCRILRFPIGGSGMRKVNKYIEQYSINISHFDNGRKRRTRYPLIIKKCPICNREFEASKDSPREKQTCSYSCANSLFRSGPNNGSYINGYSGEPEYRIICFRHYKRKCVLCNWDKSIDVHHIDGDHRNNHYKNLIPLCPNHHRLTTIKKYQKEIGKQLLKAVKKNFSK
jgi:hypothetical protein